MERALDYELSAYQYDWVRINPSNSSGISSATVSVNEAGSPADESKVRKAHDLSLKAAGLRRIRVHDLRGTFAALLVSAGVPIYHVSKMLGHSNPATTARHYADLAPGAAKETPTILERYVFEATAERNANQTRTAASAVEASKNGGA